jgi:hypothetical protein
LLKWRFSLVRTSGELTQFNYRTICFERGRHGVITNRLSTREFLGSGVQARKQGRYQDAQRDLEAHFDERDIRRAEIEDLLATVANMLEFSYRC